MVWKDGGGSPRPDSSKMSGAEQFRQVEVVCRWNVEFEFDSTTRRS